MYLHELIAFSFKPTEVSICCVDYMCSSGLVLCSYRFSNGRKSCQSKTKPPGKRQLQSESSHISERKLVKVQFVITTSPELQLFLEIAVLLLEGVYELHNCNDNYHCP